MKKYAVIYRVPVASREEWNKNTAADMHNQREKFVATMDAWTQEHAKSFIERGHPFGKTKTVTAQGVEDTTNDLAYYCVIEAESHDAAAALFADNPHILTIPGGSVYVMEIPI